MTDKANAAFRCEACLPSESALLGAVVVDGLDFAVLAGVDWLVRIAPVPTGLETAPASA